MDSKTFYTKLNTIKELPTLPTVALEVNRRLQNLETSTSELSQIIEKDQAMAGKILQLVNSAFYGFRSKINTISNALVMLGFNTVRNAVLSLSVIQAFSDSHKLPVFDPADFWRHSLAVAVTSKYISERARIQAPDSCFVAGLLHDIGKVVLAQFFSNSFSTIWKTAVNDHLTFYEAEEKLGFVKHSMIGNYLLKKWQLPQDLAAAAKYHHKPAAAVDNQELVAVVHLADVLINHFEGKTVDTIEPLNWEEIAHTTIMARMQKVDLWNPELQTEIEAACEFFMGQVKEKQDRVEAVTR